MFYVLQYTKNTARRAISAKKKGPFLKLVNTPWTVMGAPDPQNKIRRMSPTKNTNIYEETDLYGSFWW